MLQGGIQYNETRLIPNYDKNGRIYYTDENGNRIENQTNFVQRLANNTKAFLSNANDWLNNSNPDSEDYKQKANIALTLATLPIGAGAKVTQTIAKPLVPYVGKQIAKTIGQGVGAGAASGAVEGFGRGLVEQKNPILTSVTDSLLGAGFGGLGGLGVGKALKQIARKNLVNNAQNQAKYIQDYIEGLSDRASTVNQRSRFAKELADFRGAKQGYSKGNTESKLNFIGENAKNIDTAKLEEAKQLFDNGIDNEAIRQQTGWFKGVDDKWKHEIPYGELFENPEYTEWSDIYGRGSKSYSIKLKDLYNAPELYKNYPDLAEKTVYFDKMPEARGYTDYEDIYINQDFLPIINPKYQEELNAIKATKEFKDFNKFNQQFNNNEINYEDFAPIEEIWNNSPLGDRYNDLIWDSVDNIPKYLQKGDEEQLRRTLIHELQHDIQNKEGFALGAGLDDPERHLSAGEAEARLAAHRSMLRKPGELQEISPLKKGLGGYDIDPEKQITKFDHNSDSYNKFSDDEFNYDKVMGEVERLKAPKPIDKTLKKEGKIVIMKGSEPFEKGEIDKIITDTTFPMSDDEISKGYAVRYQNDHSYIMYYNENGKHTMGKFKITEEKYD